MKYIVISTAVIAAALGGIALLGFSPQLCACLTPGQHLSMVAGLDYLATQSYNANEIEAGLNRTLVGKRISVGPQDLYFLDCTQPSTTTIDCRVFTEESPLIQRGFDLHFSVLPDGEVVSARVNRAWGWP